jgi:hypothetical protein
MTPCARRELFFTHYTSGWKAERGVFKKAKGVQELISYRYHRSFFWVEDKHFSMKNEL